MSTSHQPNAQASGLQATVSAVQRALGQYEVLKQQCVDTLGYDPTLTGTSSDTQPENAGKSFVNTLKRDDDYSKRTRVARRSPPPPPARIIEEIEISDDDVPLIKRQKTLKEQSTSLPSNPAPRRNQPRRSVKKPEPEVVVIDDTTDSESDQKPKTRSAKATTKQGTTEASQLPSVYTSLPPLGSVPGANTTTAAKTTKNTEMRAVLVDTADHWHKFFFEPSKPSKFSKPEPKLVGRTGMTAKELESKTKEILDDMRAKKVPGEAMLQKDAWNQAAMEWRMKNMPPDAELNARKAEAAERSATIAAKGAATRTANHPRERARLEKLMKKQRKEEIKAVLSRKPAKNASEADKRAYYRLLNQARVDGATTFAQVLKAFKVPVSSDTSKIKNDFRVAVRMYHPDSNSKDRVWKNDEQKIECEEIMKLINERRPDDL